MSKHEFKEFDKVLVRMDNVSVWTPAFFGRLDTDEKRERYKHVTTGGTCWTQCIPYDETTKHLIGTADPFVDPDESPVFEFGDVVEVLHGIHVYIGVFITYSKKNSSFCVVAVDRGSEGIGMFTKLLKNLRFVRKGNLNE